MRGEKVGRGGGDGAEAAQQVEEVGGGGVEAGERVLRPLVVRHRRRRARVKRRRGRRLASGRPARLALDGRPLGRGDELVRVSLLRKNRDGGQVLGRHADRYARHRSSREGGLDALCVGREAGHGAEKTQLASDDA